ncbi:hypothetical protein WSM22_42720 [Cytophagales bacterium WSM2-2]|nr:hypothetical protein WSM22_42720 [Cytophagales bacterium WSM2-2]
MFSPIDLLSCEADLATLSVDLPLFDADAWLPVVGLTSRNCRLFTHPIDLLYRHLILLFRGTDSQSSRADLPFRFVDEPYD